MKYQLEESDNEYIERINENLQTMEIYLYSYPKKVPPTI